jgi:hypothetical protein
MNVNFKNTYFEFKFKRKPKNWTIEQVHELWLKAKERTNKRRSELNKCIDDMKKFVKPDDVDHREKEVYKIYHVCGDMIIKYTLSHSQYFKNSMCWQQDRIKLNTREERLSFLIDNEEKIKMGENFYNAEKNTTYMDSVVRNILEELINEELKKQRKNSDYSTNEAVLVIKISDKKYFVLEDNTRYPYRKYKLLNEMTDEINL